MSLFYSKEVKEAVREAIEKERKTAHESRLTLQAELSKESEAKMDRMLKSKDAEKKSAVQAKEEEIKLLNNIIAEKSRIFKRFQRDLDTMEILTCEMSALGTALENLTGGFTGKFHGFKTRVELIKRSVDRKERKYKDMIEK
jgi:hypothetical protein